jgi:hypothetical protein
MAKADKGKTRQIRLTITKKLSQGIHVTIVYENEAEIIEKLGSWGLLEKLKGSDLRNLPNRIPKSFRALGRSTIELEERADSSIR